MGRGLLVGLIVLLGLTSTTAFAQEAGVGAFAEFKVGFDARALGMGGAFVAVADNYSAPYWNPAGIAIADGPRIGGMYTNKFMADMTLNFLSGIMTIAGMSVAGTYMGMSTSAPASDGSIINWNSMVFSGTVAMNIAGIGTGGTVKFYSSSAAGVNASGVGFDVGLLVTGIIPGLSMGVAAFDLSNTKITWTTGAIDLVGTLTRYGAAVTLFRGAFILSTELDLGEDVETTWRWGWELNPLRLIGGFPLEISARGGMVNLVDYKSSALTLGLGIKLFWFHVDGAWVQNSRMAGAETLVISGEMEF